MNSRPLACLVSIGLLGCAPAPEPEVPFEETDTLVYSDIDGDDGADSQATSMTTAMSDATSDDASDEGSSSGSGFVNSDLDTSCGQRCDIWDPTDCPNGQKCTAVACEVGSSAWDSNICVDIMGWEPVGASCQYFGSGLDGLDDCELGSMCWDQDPDTTLGTCLAFCQGTPSDATCAEGSYCHQSGDGTIPACLPICDPLAQDCPYQGDLCLPGFDNESWICVLDASADMAPRGTPCAYANSCNAGLICADVDRVDAPSCVDSAGCCTPMCDTTQANTCPGASEECVNLGVPGSLVGACLIPEGP